MLWSSSGPPLNLMKALNRNRSDASIESAQPTHTTFPLVAIAPPRFRRVYPGRPDRWVSWGGDGEESGCGAAVAVRIEPGRRRRRREGTDHLHPRFRGPHRRAGVVRGTARRSRMEGGAPPDV